MYFLHCIFFRSGTEEAEETGPGDLPSGGSYHDVTSLLLTESAAAAMASWVSNEPPSMSCSAGTNSVVSIDLPSRRLRSSVSSVSSSSTYSLPTPGHVHQARCPHCKKWMLQRSMNQPIKRQHSSRFPFNDSGISMM